MSDTPDTEIQYREITNQTTNNNETMTEKPHTELVKIQSEDPKTHALLCAIVREKRRMETKAEQSDDDHCKKYADHLDEWEETVMDAYFHDRRAEDPTVGTVQADD